MPGITVEHLEILHCDKPKDTDDTSIATETREGEEIGTDIQDNLSVKAHQKSIDSIRAITYNNRG